MKEKPNMLSVAVGDGKYTVIQDATGKTYALRHGEPWRDCVGDNLVLALAYEVDALREKLARLEAGETRAKFSFDHEHQPENECSAFWATCKHCGVQIKSSDHNKKWETSGVSP